MTVRERAPARPAEGVDLDTTLELLASLTQYAEAGAVQPHTLAQAAQHALETHGDRVSVLVAVGKLYLSAGDGGEATRVLGRAARMAPEDRRVVQLLADAGEKPSSGRAHPSSGPPQPSSGTRTPTSDTRARSGPVSSAVKGAVMSPPPEPPPTSSGNRALFRSAGPSSAAAEAQALRPTVRMTKVASPPERVRWGSATEARALLDARAERETPVEDPTARTADAHTPPPTSIRTGREPPPSGDAASPASRSPARSSSRAATGGLKMLDPHDERRHLDRYELIGEIASGGMASVFLARLGGVAGFQRFFAIKRLHPHLADEQEFIDMFLDEARLAAGIHHPNAVSILEVGTTDAGHYLVMDYIEGETLSGVIHRAASSGGMPRPIAARILVDALHGLHAAHELTDPDGKLVDLVHRDCSPQNILIGLDGSSRITDFGVARASSRLSTTRSATVKGKLAYLSPEQATGRILDRRSDLFGMGVILWEVLAGRRLFRADSDGATLSRILVEPIPPLSQFAEHLPETVCVVVSTALARDPEDRFATAADMADALDQAIREAGDPDFYVATPRDVATYMRDLLGSEMTTRREVVRAWTAQSTDPPASSGPRSQATRRADDAAPPSSARRPTPVAERDTPIEAASEPPTGASEPPTSTTEPSAVHDGVPPAATAPVIETAGTDTPDRSEPSEPVEVTPTAASAGSAVVTAARGTDAASEQPAKGEPPTKAEPAKAEPAKAAPANGTPPADPTLPAATSPIRSIRPRPEPKPPPKRAPVALIVLALIVIAIAIFVYMVQVRTPKPAGLLVQPAATAPF